MTSVPVRDTNASMYMYMRKGRTEGLSRSLDPGRNDLEGTVLGSAVMVYVLQQVVQRELNGTPAIQKVYLDCRLRQVPR